MKPPPPPTPGHENIARPPIVWCCPFCQRMFDVGCCPEHHLPTAEPQLLDVLKHSADFLYKQGVGDGAAAVDDAVRLLSGPYTAPDNEQAKEMAAQRVSARGPVQQEESSDGRSTE